MSKKANPALIGSFVVGAVALVVVAVVGLGGQDLFRERPSAVAYFDGSVNGLQVGAPVTWLGVRIGSVTEVRMDFDANRRSVRIPVFMEFEPERINIVGGTVNLLRIKDLVANGLCASLQQQSLVTGQLFVDLKMRPDSCKKTVGPSQFLIPEIPTELSDFDTLKEALERLPLKDLGAEAIKTLATINKLVASPETQATLTELAASAKDLDSVLSKINGQGDPFPLLKNTNDLLVGGTTLAKTADGVLAGTTGVGKSANDALAGTGELMKTATGVLAGTGGLGKSAKESLEAAAASLRDAQTTLASFNSVIAPTSQQRSDINQILHNLAYTSQSLRSFSEQIDRNPNSILTGKK